MKKVKDTGPKAPKIDPEAVAKALGAKVVKPEGKMLEAIRRAAFWFPSLRGKY